MSHLWECLATGADSARCHAEFSDAFLCVLLGAAGVSLWRKSKRLTRMADEAFETHQMSPDNPIHLARFNVLATRSAAYDTMAFVSFLAGFVLATYLGIL